MDRDREIDRMNEREFTARETAHKETLAAMGIQDEYFDQRPQPSEQDIKKINRIKEWIAEELRTIKTCDALIEKNQILGVDSTNFENIKKQHTENIQKFKDELKKYGVDNVE